MLRLVALTALLLVPFRFARAQDPVVPADTTVVTTASGLKYSVLVPGKTDAHPKPGDRVKMHYTLWLGDGVYKQSSKARGPLEFVLGRDPMIKGWDEATALMSPGAKFKLTVPPELGYGAQGRGDIPGNATLIYVVEMVDFVAMPPFHAPNKEAQKKTAAGTVYEVLREGAGESPKDTDVVSLKLAQWSPEGELQLCSERDMNNQALTDVVTHLPVPILIEAAHILKPGGRVRLEATAKFAYGDRLSPGMAPDAPTVWEVELLAIKKPMPIPPFEMPAADKLKRTASGLAYEVIREGAGKTPKLGKEITVHYAGWTADGMLFDSTYQRATPMVRPFGNVIQGWVEGLQLMKEGAIYKFVIPSNLGYGKPGNPDAKIPPDTTLVFWLELVSCAE